MKLKAVFTMLVQGVVVGAWLAAPALGQGIRPNDPRFHQQWA